MTYCEIEHAGRTWEVRGIVHPPRRATRDEPGEGCRVEDVEVLGPSDCPEHWLPPAARGINSDVCEEALIAAALESAGEA